VTIPHSRAAVAVLVCLAVGASPDAHAQGPTLNEVLLRAGAYVAAFNRDLASIVAEEHYIQDWHRPRNGDGSGGTEHSRRELRSDLMLVRPAGASDWVQYRDAFEVDGAPVRDRAERLTKLFARPSATTEAQIARIQQESARYNIGNIERDLNTPVFALQFLATDNQASFRFKRANDRKSALGEQGATDTGTFRVSTEIWVVQYEEVGSPTIIHSLDGRDVPARGRFWIEPQSGRVLMSELNVADRRRQGTINVSYQSEPLLGLLVPIEMRERYEERKIRSRIEGNATYGRFRLLPPPAH
jgi:hypothetical protein